ncbi:MULTISPECIES: LysR family transcriptional regulator [unclassified Pseudomonas]|uniref:LysR family transcriptional regulator n=1 Tax=unclassified Pseudomonas TaxID=196821 RepID=UPI002AC9C8DF|nr:MULTISPECIES: LysR family transcriptional regulator [unclassified Pseudomonas]MEB0040368.1 LysR family transcriptional regulator [Pseudomonas sp. MH10]MEB0078198.1 LysR family transcriptional regulator [Pseudomonas sp. MH10out]MEB0093083.1 LysR family transcriptional regulator [Pseudomonas sp. CCI4.2]MEB0100040.1 LysR family transcriptional regulator [Pseudomonas sp. CCI3.2]MEB0120869.1 LysR family transcriptional regulator [Pseudomonas sp. CCI1.2]
MRFDLIDLRLFLNITESGNITAGASRSHLSLASASARVRALEASLGTPLLERGRRGVTPTPAGKAMTRHARLILQQVDRMQFCLTDYAKGFKGQVRLLCNTSALTEYLPELLADFLIKHPSIDVDLEEHPSLRILEAVRQGAADIGIISDAVDASDLQTVPFRDDPLALVMPLDHALSSHQALCFAQTLDYDHIALASNNAMSIYLEEQALHAGKRLRIRARAEGFSGVMRMVARGTGLGIVPQAAVDRWQHAHHLKSVPLSDPWADRKLLLCAADFNVLPGYAKTLLNDLTTAFLDTSMSSTDN